MTGRDFSVEPMIPADVAAVARLVKSTFDTKLWPYMTYTQRGAAEFMKVPVTYPSAFPELDAYVTREGDEPIAFASFQREASGDAFLSYICVDSRFRGQGLATLLITRFLAAHPTVSNLRLDVFADNAAAGRLYSKLGFVLEARSAWLIRAMPDVAPPLPVDKLALALAAHAQYGFCQLSVATRFGHRTYGVLGGQVIRCSDRASFDDDESLASVRGVFDADTAFAVIPEHEVVQVATNHQLVLWSQRMVLKRSTAGRAA